MPIAAGGKKSGRHDKLIFIDAFGGGGLVGISNSNYSILGSTLLAATADLRGCCFDEIITIEKDKERADLMNKRCNALGLNNVKVINADVNDVIDSLPSSAGITNKSIIMLFIDPEGMEPEFSKFLTLSNTTDYIDIILNYTFGVRRLSGRIEYNHNSADIAKMKKMCNITNNILGIL